MVSSYEILELLILGLLAIVGFFVKRAFDRMDRMEEELKKHKEDDLLTYATKDHLREIEVDFQTFLKEVMEPVNRKLESIEVHLRDRHN